MKELNDINSEHKADKLNTSKSSNFVENTKRAVRKALVTTGIAASSIGPVATTTTPTVVPASINTITAIAPLASNTVKAISLGTAANLLAACGKEDGPDGPINPNPIETKDTIAPTININQSEVDITGGKQIRIDGNQLYIGEILVASRSDDKSKNCSVELSLNGKSITSGTTISERGILTIKISDDAKNTKNADIKLNSYFDISGLENLKNLNMQVDQEVNLLNGINLGNGAKLIKIEIEIDGEKVIISDPNHYIPEYPGTCSIIITIKDKNGETKEYRVDNLTIKTLEYKSMEINNIRPIEILPIIGQVEVGDEKVYEHIEHLRIAEATRIRDMMWKYGTGNHSPEEYKQLMMRLNTGMLGENPLGYDNYEAVGGDPVSNPSDHAHNERNILNTLIKHANFKIIDIRDYGPELYNLAKNNPNKIIIVGNSMDSDVDKIQYNSRRMEKYKKYLKEKNLILFGAGSNIREKNGYLLQKIYQENYDLPDLHSTYSSISAAHDKNDNSLDIHIMVTIGTNKNGNADITNEVYEASKFPVGFHQKVLFSGRAFPFYNSKNTCYSESDCNYATSYTNYVNVAMTDLCFQMFAEVKDVDELLEMIRSTTLTDYIRLDGETQQLQLINPAGFFQKYLMPTDIPNNLKPDKTTPLNKGYYKGVIFNIPGAEVKIDGQWIVYNDANKSLIKSQNPMTLEWRVNGNLCKKLGYKGKNIKGKVIVVDDKWNGLNIDKDFSISIQ